MKTLPESVTESIIVPVSLQRTWSVADNPRKLTTFVPMLGRFAGPETLVEGSPLTETHTILGWSQKFRGFVTAFRPLESWAMTSAPVTPGPASLPHDVEYSFRQTDAGTCVTIQCSYARGGVLQLPFARVVVRFLMGFTLRRLLRTISKAAQKLNNHETSLAYVQTLN